MMIQPNEQFMRAAIVQAQKAYESGDYAIGAVMVKNDTIITTAPNTSRVSEDPTNHAEMNAIRQASQILGSRHLIDCILYTTHEPCPMCSGAAVMAMLGGIVFGATMEDMAEFRLKAPREQFLWRPGGVSARVIAEKGTPPVPIIEEFMRMECKALFHS